MAGFLYQKDGILLANDDGTLKSGDAETPDPDCCCEGVDGCCDPPILGAGNAVLSVTSANCPCINGDYELENIGPNIWQLNFAAVCDTLNFISVECINGFFLLRFSCFSGDNVFIEQPTSQSCDPLEVTWTGAVTEAGTCMGEGCIITATLTPA